MSGRPPLVTFGSNVLVGAAQAGDPRRDAALGLLRLAAGGRCVLTLQALGEFFFAATRKRFVKRPAAAAQVRRWITLFPSPPVAASASAVAAEMDAAAEGRFAYWDALLLAAAAEAGCAAAISEGMGDGAALGSIRVVPAFAGDDGVNPAARTLLA